MTVDLRQVFGFLPVPALQPTALEVLLGVSSGEEILEVLRGDRNHVQALLALSKREAALKVLVNVSRDVQVAELIWSLIQTDGDLHQTTTSKLTSNFGRMLFCNLSKVPACKEYLMEHHLADILRQSDDQHCQYILVELSTSMNMSVFEALLEKYNNGYDDVFASVTKNMLFNVDNHDQIVSLLDYPKLACIKEPTVTQLEMLLLLCTTFGGRQRLRECNVYDSLKQAHLQSTVDEYRELVERVVELLIRDEDL